MLQRFRDTRTRPVSAPAATSVSAPEPCRFRLILAAWGTGDVSITCRLTLPSLMASSNLGAIDAPNARAPASILCLAGDRGTFETSEDFRAFAADRDIEWHFVDGALTEFGDVRDAILGRAVRRLIAAEQSRDVSTTYLLVKAAMVLADGALLFAKQAAEDGARAVLTPLIFGNKTSFIALPRTTMAARDLVESCFQDPVFYTSAFSGSEKPFGFAPIDRLLKASHDGSKVLISARWHPLLINPSAPIDAEKGGFIDGEIVPEFVADHDDVRWAATSDEALIVELRSEAWLNRSVDGENLTAQEAISRMRSWTTPWQSRALARRYRLVSQEVSRTNLDHDPFAALIIPEPGESTADKGSIWLQACGFRFLPPALGREKRYQNYLDDYYRVSRLAIEASMAENVIYLGHASHVFAPLLARVFKLAFLGDPNRFLFGSPLTVEHADTFLIVVHIDVPSFLLLSRNERNSLISLTARGMRVLLIVEAPDEQGGLGNLDLAALQRWYGILIEQGNKLGIACQIRSTIIDFFHGHPGFVVEIFAPMPVSAAALPAVAKPPSIATPSIATPGEIVGPDGSADRETVAS